MEVSRTERLARRLGRLTAKAVVASKPVVAVMARETASSVRNFQPRQMKWGIAAIWVLFLLALFASNFFLVAAEIGIFAAIQFGAFIGPHQPVYGECYFDCYAPAFSIPVKWLFVLTIAVSIGLWLWAAERSKAIKDL